MRFSVLSSVFVAIFALGLFTHTIGAPKLSLSEKIALAKKLADEAAQGKAEVGRVVENNFDFAAELKKFRALESSSSDKNAVLDDSVIEAETNAQSEEKIVSADSKKTTSSVLSKKEDLPKAKKTETEKKPLSDKKDEKTKYAVDTSKDFVNGYYVGVLGEDDAELKERRKREILEKEAIEKEMSKTKYFSFSSSLFEIVSDDYDAHTTMIYIAEEFEKFYASYFSQPNSKLNFAKKIWLNVSAKNRDKTKKRVSVSKGNEGGVSVNIAWLEDLKIEDLCLAVSEAMILKTAYETTGNVTPKKIPVWLKLGLSIGLEQTVRYGVAADCARLASENPPSSVFTIFANEKNDNLSAAHAYFAIVSIEKATKKINACSAFMRAACSGNTPAELVKKMEILKPQNVDFELWWRCLITGEIWARMGGVLSPKRSAEEIARLAVLSVDSPEGGRVGVSGSKIIENSEALQKEINLRLLEIKVALSNINPLYHNALVSLGEMFEYAKVGDKNEFNEAKARFVVEFQNASRLSLETINMIRK